MHNYGGLWGLDVVDSSVQCHERIEVSINAKEEGVTIKSFGACRQYNIGED